MRLASLAAALWAAAGAVAAEPFTLIGLGDMPYGDPARVYPPYEVLIDTINARDPTLVIHLGDTKSGRAPCTDQVLAEQLAYLNRFQAPALYTPGDNEWTDCHRLLAGGYDPVERLEHIRSTYFSDPETTFGAPLPVVSQAAEGYPENARLLVDDVVILTVHVVGTNNNFDPTRPGALAEFTARDAAGRAWLQAGFEAATEVDAAAVVVAIHANIFDGDWGLLDRVTFPPTSGFRRFGPDLRRLAGAFGRPVLLLYGDSHVFRQARPFPAVAPNLLALEVPGGADMHAVEIGVDTDAPGVFSVGFLRNPALTD